MKNETVVMVIDELFPRKGVRRSLPYQGIWRRAQRAGKKKAASYDTGIDVSAVTIKAKR